ncbi:MAG: pyrroloquinoline-quinone synthase PqqC [Pseudomonadota bacterium]
MNTPQPRSATLDGAPPPARGRAPDSRSAFEARLRAIGEARYHDKHPFHTRLHGGACSPDEVRAWVLNRFCYQAAIPRKDAALMARCDDPEMRRIWRSRIEDHDGAGPGEGGIERWLVLADCVGLDRGVVASRAAALPAVKFAVEAYVRFVAERSLLEAVASSLTELFAAKIHKDRIAGLLAHYDFADDRALSYFRTRLSQAPKDVAFGLGYVLDHADTAEKQDAAAAALTFKTDVLWAQLDAIDAAYGPDGRIPPGAWRPGEALIDGASMERGS